MDLNIIFNTYNTRTNAIIGTFIRNPTNNIIESFNLNDKDTNNIIKIINDNENNQLNISLQKNKDKDDKIYLYHESESTESTEYIKLYECFR